jgi:glycosyltransferase involved in cell wall biosynthesis
MKVSIVLVVRNREDYIKFLNDLFLEIEQRASNSIQFEYFFYENNSTDNTKGEIEKFYETRSCTKNIWRCK